jgi:membrane protease YdiL (CAAX protease family)
MRSEPPGVDESGRAKGPTVTLVIAAYFLINAGWVLLTKLPGWLAWGEGAGFAFGRVANPLLLTLAVFALASRFGPPVSILRLGRPAPGYLGLALVASLPPLLAVAWHGATQSFGPLASGEGARLLARIALNQAWFEELTGRGLLLGVLLLSAMSQRRAVIVSALCFGLGHLLQFMAPPVSLAGLVNGLVLVVLTTPMGVVFALLSVRSGSIWPAMLLHLLTDLVILPQKLLTPSMSVALAATLLTFLAAGLALWKVPAFRAKGEADPLHPAAD